MRVAPLSCHMKSRHGDLAALVLIGHSYLISGLSDLDGRARGKETGEPNERRCCDRV
jgi:hypothetical protein